MLVVSVQTYIGSPATGYQCMIQVGYICSGAIQSLACADVLHSFVTSTVHHVLGNTTQTPAAALVISLHCQTRSCLHPGQPPYIRHSSIPVRHRSLTANHTPTTPATQIIPGELTKIIRKNPGLALAARVQHTSQHLYHSASSCACCRLHQRAQHLRPGPAQSLQRPIPEVGELAGGAVAVGDART